MSLPQNGHAHGVNKLVIIIVAAVAVLVLGVVTAIVSFNAGVASRGGVLPSTSSTPKTDEELTTITGKKYSFDEQIPDSWTPVVVFAPFDGWAQSGDKNVATTRYDKTYKDGQTCSIITLAAPGKDGLLVAGDDKASTINNFGDLLPELTPEYVKGHSSYAYYPTNNGEGVEFMKVNVKSNGNYYLMLSRTYSNRGNTGLVNLLSIKCSSQAQTETVWNEVKGHTNLVYAEK